MSTTSTLYYINSTSNIISPYCYEILSQYDISNNLLPPNTFTDISGITIGTNVERLENYLFTGCSNLASIVIYNTDLLTYIGSNIFDDVSSNGMYSFYSKQASPNNYYYTPNVQRLEKLLLDPHPNWITDLSYVYYTDFGILCNDVTRINKSNVEYYDFEPIDISYNQFHALFFANNSFFNLSPYTYVKNDISLNDFYRYTVINNQILQVYPNNNLSTTPTDLSFNLYSTVINHYQENIPYQCWSIESTMQLNKQLTRLKTIYDFANYFNCGTYSACGTAVCSTAVCSCNKRKNTCKTSSCQDKNNTKLTLDDMFNIFELQGVVMALDNSFNSTPIQAKDLPVNAAITNYMAILNLYLRSNNSNVSDISLRMPYLINFASSMPKSQTDTNNYRYNP